MIELITGVLVAVAAVALVLEPLIRYRPGLDTVQPDDPAEEILDLEESESPKVQALLALREIEFDRATGKLSDEDYSALKKQYSQMALTAIRAEDANGDLTGRKDGSVPDIAEQAVAAIRRDGKRECPVCDVPTEPGAVYCSQCGRSLLEPNAHARCLMCGADIDNGARFCGECGFALSA
jgi:predicted nucleic acid-binding Zn ribbon protein